MDPIRCWEFCLDRMDKSTWGPYFQGKATDDKAKKRAHSSLVRIWQKMAKHALLNIRITSHSLRCSVTTELVDAGMNVDFIKTLQKWSDKSKMVGRYNREDNILSQALQNMIQKHASTDLALLSTTAHPSLTRST